MKASNLTQAYNKEKDLDIKVNKTFFVPPSNIFIEEGFNVRELDQDHIDSIAESYKRGVYVPAVVVKATADGFKVIDGHHRYKAAIQAEVLRVECKDFKGSDADQIAFMITSSQGRNLAPMERALAYQRLVAQGWSEKEISEKVGRGLKNVKDHLMLLDASPQIQNAVKSGHLGFAAAVEELNRNGLEGQEKIEQALEQADGGKVTRTTLQSGLTKAEYKEVMELLNSIGEEFLPERLIELREKYNNG